ncbi:hypothetical protein ACLM5H_04220 [Fredinandcohnia humi]
MKEHNLNEISFPRHKMSESQKNRILSYITDSNKHSISTHKKIIMPILSGIIMVMLTLGIGIFSYQLIFNQNEHNASNVNSLSIGLPDDIRMVERKSQHVFLKDDTVVGGIDKITNDRKKELLSQPGIYENDMLEDFIQPTQRILIHVKQMHAIQTVHYLIQPAGQDIIYDVYFHANTPGYFGSSTYNGDLEIIHEIAKTFKITKP